MPDHAPRVAVRPATSDESLPVRRVLDGALLEVSGLDERIEAGDVLVAVDDGRICGAIVVAPEGPDRPHERSESAAADDGPGDESTDVESMAGEASVADSSTADSSTADSSTADSSTADSSTADSSTADSGTADSSLGEYETAPEPCRDAAHVRAVAVRRRRRGSGIGSALVRDAAARFGALAADFDDDLRPFYAPLAETVVDGADGRSWARVEAPG